MNNTSITAVDQTFDISCPVNLFSDSQGFSFYHPGKKYYDERNITFDELKQQINSITFHHSATYRAKDTYNGLVGRGLSVQLSIDDDCDENGYATVFQFLNLKDGGWSQGPLNHCSIGIEISYQPIISNGYSNDLKQKHGVQDHSKTSDTIHGHLISGYGPSESQIKSLIQLTWGLCNLFDIPAKFPRDGNGNLVKTIIEHPEQYKGLLNHFNITTEKIDALGLDCERMEKEVGERLELGF